MNLSGKYIPSIAKRILDGNTQGGGAIINLQGLGIGSKFVHHYVKSLDGWSDPIVQNYYYIPFA